MNVTKLGLPSDLSPVEKIRAQMSMNTGMMGGAMQPSISPEQIHAMFETKGAVLSEKPKGGKRTTRKVKRSARKSLKRR
jgi:hypothetical protein